MKAEIYSVMDKSFNPKTLDKKMNSVTKQLRDADIEILYKTDLEADKIKLLEALRQSYATDEGIQLIIIANALDGTAQCDTIKLFKKLCPKHTELTDAEDEQTDISEYKDKGGLDDLATEYDRDAKSVKKSSKKKSKKSKSKEEPVETSRVVNEIWSTGDLGKGYEGCFMLYSDKLVLALPKESLTKVSTADMIISGAKKATSARGITTGNLVGGKITDHFDYYSIAQNDYKSKKKKGLLANFIPMPGDKPLEVVRKVILMAATITFAITAVILCKLLFIEPAQVEDKYNEVRKIIHNVDVNDEETDPALKKANRFEKLRAINPEIMGWLYIPKTTYIDYPVLEHKGDGPNSQFYLWRDYTGGDSKYGSLFIDYRCEDSIHSKNIIIHGHNMDNGMVFHQLLSYSDINFYKNSPIMQFDTPEFDADWKIISIYKTNTLGVHGEFFNYLRGTFDTEKDFMDFVYNTMERSLIDTGVTVNENDQLLTLSTCSYEFNEFRTVIVARRVRKGEESSVDLTKAAYNPDAVWPQCYYARNGGVRKELTDFVTACKSNQTPWYDGDYKLDGVDFRKVKDSDSETDTEETDSEEEESQEENQDEENNEEESHEEETHSEEQVSSEEEPSWTEPEPSSSEEEQSSSEPEPTSSEEEPSWYEPEPVSEQEPSSVAESYLEEPSYQDTTQE